MIYFSNDKKYKLQYYLKTSKTIQEVSLPKFPFDGNYLKNRGIKEGALIGQVLKLLENEWLNNDFKISKHRISQIINNRNN